MTNRFWITLGLCLLGCSDKSTSNEPAAEADWADTEHDDANPDTEADAEVQAEDEVEAE